MASSNQEYIGIYGGSFDPPHLGHIMVVSHLLLNYPGISRVYVVPCFQQAGKKLTDFEHRMTMCARAFSWLPRVRVLPIERELGGESLTVRLLRSLVDQEPEVNFRFIMGSDLRLAASTWEGWDEIKELAPPLVIGRAGISPLNKEDPTPISPMVSSTLVREALAKGNYREAGRYLPVQVCQYIEMNKLYLTGE